MATLTPDVIAKLRADIQGYTWIRELSHASQEGGLIKDIMDPNPWQDHRSESERRESASPPPHDRASGSGEPLSGTVESSFVLLFVQSVPTSHS